MWGTHSRLKPTISRQGVQGGMESQRSVSCGLFLTMWTHSIPSLNPISWAPLDSNSMRLPWPTCRWEAESANCFGRFLIPFPHFISQFCYCIYISLLQQNYCCKRLSLGYQKFDDHRVHNQTRHSPQEALHRNNSKFTSDNAMYNLILQRHLLLHALLPELESWFCNVNPAADDCHLFLWFMSVCVMNKKISFNVQSLDYVLIVPATRRKCNFSLRRNGSSFSIVVWTIDIWWGAWG